METYLKYYDLLELPPQATIEEIYKVYVYLKNFYSGDSIELSALNADFSDELRQDCLNRLDEAYEQLRMLLESRKTETAHKRSAIDGELRAWISTIGTFSGGTLKAIRQRMGVELSDIFAVSRIQPHYLEDIENEQFGSFRAEVFLRSYLIEYTRFLALDTDKVLADYLPRYRNSRGSAAGIYGTGLTPGVL